MPFYIACANAECDEHQVPKETPDSFREVFEAGDITCGGCQQPISTEVAAP